MGTCMQWHAGIDRRDDHAAPIGVGLSRSVPKMAWPVLVVLGVMASLMLGDAARAQACPPLLFENRVDLGTQGFIDDSYVIEGIEQNVAIDRQDGLVGAVAERIEATVYDIISGEVIGIEYFASVTLFDTTTGERIASLANFATGEAYADLTTEAVDVAVYGDTLAVSLPGVDQVQVWDITNPPQPVLQTTYDFGSLPGEMTGEVEICVQDPFGLRSELVAVAATAGQIYIAGTDFTGGPVLPFSLSIGHDSTTANSFSLSSAELVGSNSQPYSVLTVGIPADDTVEFYTIFAIGGTVALFPAYAPYAPAVGAGAMLGTRVTTASIGDSAVRVATLAPGDEAFHVYDTGTATAVVADVTSGGAGGRLSDAVPSLTPDGQTLYIAGPSFRNQDGGILRYDNVGPGQTPVFIDRVEPPLTDYDIRFGAGFAIGEMGIFATSNNWMFDELVTGELYRLTLPAGEDCDGNGVPDTCQIYTNPFRDLDSDGRLDFCQIQADPSLDCNGDGVLDSASLGPGLAALSDTNLDITQTNLRDSTGRAMVMRDGVMYVGLALDPAFGARDGRVVVVDVRDPSNPTDIAEIAPPVDATFTYFGDAIASAGDLLLIGAPGLDTPAAESGAVYIYDVSDPLQPQYRGALPIPSVASGDRYGSAIATDGRYVAVGARYHTSLMGLFTGIVHVFDLIDPSSPMLVATVEPNDLAAYDGFGASVAIRDGVLAVGMPGRKSDTTANVVGSVRLYANAMTTPTFAADLRIEDATSGSFGTQVELLAGGMLAASDPTAVLGFGNSGVVRLYDVSDPGNPTVHSTIRPLTGTIGMAQFGKSIASSDDGLLLIGAPALATSAAPARGAAFLYDISDVAAPVMVAQVERPLGDTITEDGIGGSQGVHVALGDGLLAIADNGVASGGYTRRGFVAVAPTPNVLDTDSSGVLDECEPVWTLISEDGPPPAREEFAMSTGLGGAGALLYGGLGANGRLGDTWSWNGSEWQEVLISTGDLPGVRSGQAMVYDAARNQIVMHGGRNFASGLEDTQTFVFGGTAWANVTDTAAPGPAVINHAMAYDEAREQVVLFGGLDVPPAGFPLTTVGETWTWNGAAWSRHDVSGPSPRSYAAMAYDQGSSRVILFGGLTGDIQSNPMLSNETWAWNGAVWTQLTPATSPPLRFGAHMVYDAERNGIVLFGGYGGQDVLGDTWLFADGAWTLIDEGGPASRGAYGIAYDAAHGETILFGGNVEGVGSPSANLRQDTWVYGAPNLDMIGEDPIADAGGPYAFSAITPTLLTLSGANSTDPDGVPGVHPIALWQWDLGNDGSVEAAGSDPAFYSVFRVTRSDAIARGLRVDADVPVRLTVTDADGNTDSDITAITYESAPPAIEIQNPDLINFGPYTTFNFVALATDVDAEIDSNALNERAFAELNTSPTDSPAEIGDGSAFIDLGSTVPLGIPGDVLQGSLTTQPNWQTWVNLLGQGQHTLYAECVDRSRDEVVRDSFRVNVTAPDLIVEEVIVSPITAGDQYIAVTLRIRNQGGVNLPTQLFSGISYEVKDDATGTTLYASNNIVSIPGLSPGQNADVFVSVGPLNTPVAAGIYRIEGRIDTNNDVPELNGESNNTFVSEPISTGQIDLAVAGVEFVDLTMGDTTLRVRLTIENLGTVDFAGDEAVSVSYNVVQAPAGGDPIGFFSGVTLVALSSLEHSGGSQTSVEFDVPLPTPPTLNSTVLMEGVFDQPSSIVEIDEITNNTFTLEETISQTALPDFVINADTSEVRTQGPIYIGEVTPNLEDITLVARNRGDGGIPAGAVRTHAAYLSASTTPQPGDPRIDFSTSVERPAASADREDLRSRAFGPMPTTPGVYNVLGVADVDANIAESDETNNISPIGAITVYDEPHIEVLDFPDGPAFPLMPGDSFNVIYTARETSGSPTRPHTDAVVLSTNTTYGDADDVQVGSASIAAINGFGEYTSTIAITIPAGTAFGTYNLILRLNADEAFPQSTFVGSEYLIADFIVGETPPPDLALDGSEQVTIPAGTLYEGMPTPSGTVISYATANIGDGPVPDGQLWREQVTISQSQTPQPGDPFRSVLRGGELFGPTDPPLTSSYTLFDFFQTLPEPGTYNVIVSIDRNNVIPESDETNNTAIIGTFDVLGIPDIAAGDFVGSPPSVFVLDETQHLSYTASNASDSGLATGHRDRIILSENNVLGDGDNEEWIATFEQGALAPGASYTGDIDITLSSQDIEPGNYFLFVELAFMPFGSEPDFPESDDTNNIIGPVAVRVDPSPPLNLLAYYPFENGGADISGHERDADIQGPMFTSGITGRAILFDGIDDRVISPVDINPSVVPALTMGAWARPNRSDGVRQVLSHDNAEFDRALAIDFRAGPSTWAANAGSTGVVGGVPVVLNQWVFVAVVYDENGDRVAIYVEDALTGELVEIEGVAPLDEGGVITTHIGASPTFDQFWSGEIDEVFFIDGALSPSRLDSIRRLGRSVLLRDVQLPDLHVENAATPSPAFEGTRITLSWTTRNAGVGRAPGPWVERVYISEDGAFSPFADTELEIVRTESFLAAGDAEARTLSVQLPTDGSFREGNYSLFIVADADDEVIESGDTNNISAPVPLTIERLPMPDLVVEMVNPVGTVASSGMVDVRFRVRNVGPAATSTPVWTDRVYFSLDDTLTTSDDPSLGAASNPIALAPGAAYESTIRVTLPSDFQATGARLFVRTDADGSGFNAVEEEDESNNDASTTPFDIDLEAQPDLQALNVGISLPGGVASGDLTLISGESFDVLWTSLNSNASENTGGPTDVANWRTTIELIPVAGGDAVRSFTVTRPTSAGLLPGGVSEPRRASNTLPFIFEGTYLVRVTEDSSNQVSEFGYENNNVGLSTARVIVTQSPAPDLAALEITGAPAAIPGQSIPIRYRVENVGAPLPFSDSWSDRVYLSLDASFDASDRLLRSFSRSGSGDLGEYEVNSTVAIPSDVEPGTYRLILITNADSGLYEGDNLASNEIAAADDTVIEERFADLVINAPNLGASSAAPGDTFSVSWEVTNAGTADTLASSWVDRVYLSTDDTFSGSDVLLAESPRQGILRQNRSYQRSAAITIPGFAFGEAHILVRTDATGVVLESDEANTSTAAFEVLAEAADLVVDAIMPPTETPVAGEPFSVTMTLRNAGTRTTLASSWSDRLVFRAADVSRTFTTRSLGHGGAIEPGATYQHTLTLTAPIDFAGQAELVLTADSTTRVFELDESNNTDAATFDITAATPANLVAQTLSLTGATNPGSTVTLDWSVTNAGAAATNVGSWTDRVVLSRDDQLGSDTTLLTQTRVGALASTEGYSVNTTATIPANASGTYTLLLITNDNNAVYEAGQAADNVVVGPSFTVLTANLIARTPSTSATAVSGQPINVQFAVDNIGQAETPTSSWSDRIYLSRDRVYDNNDAYVGAVPRTSPLAAGTGYTQNTELLLPPGITGPYFLILRTDALGQVPEPGFEDDNTAASASLVRINLPDPPDFAIDSVAPPSDAELGGLLDLSWITENIESTDPETNAFDGLWEDSLFLSTDRAYSPGDAFIGRATTRTNGALQPGGTVTTNAALPVPPVTPGDYFVVVRSDGRNRVPETDEDNNTGASLTTVNVDAATLLLGQAETDAYASGFDRYFKVDLPQGETIRFTLDHTSVGAFSELYLRQGELPTLGEFDFRTLVTGTPNATLLVPFAEPGRYFLLARASGSTPSTSADLLGAVLPFAVVDAGPTLVGPGEVTLRILGSRTPDDTRFTLVPQAGGDPVPATRTRVTGTAEFEATFNLRGASGDYDLVAEADTPGGMETATFDTPISIDPNGASAYLEVAVLDSARPRVGTTYAGRISVRNAGNTDVQAGRLVVALPAVGADLVDFNLLPEDIASGLSLGSTDTAATTGEGSDTARLLLGRLRPGQSIIVPYSIRFNAPFGTRFGPAIGGVADARTELVDDLIEPVVIAAADRFEAALASQGLAPESAADAAMLFADDALTVFNTAGTTPADALEPFRALVWDLLAAPPATERVILAQALRPIAGSAAAIALGTGFDTEIDSALDDLDAFVLGIEPGAPCELNPQDPTCGPRTVALIPDPCSLADVVVGDAAGRVLRPADPAECWEAPVISIDPNEITGTGGVGDLDWVPGDELLTFHIEFENEAAASGPAAQVQVMLPLSPGVAFGSVRQSRVGVAETEVELPRDRLTYRTSIPLQAPSGDDVDVNYNSGVRPTTTVGRAEGDETEAFWELLTIDPTTGEPPLDPFDGFLPPNDETGRGAGFFDFAIRPSGATGEMISFRADIVFDTNEPIATNTLTYTIDATRPISSLIDPPPFVAEGPTIAMTFTAEDPAGSGLLGVQAYVSVDGGPYTAFQPITLDGVATFDGESGHVYRFALQALDAAGNEEPLPVVPDATTTIPALALASSSDTGVQGDAITAEAMPTFTIVAPPFSAVPINITGPVTLTDEVFIEADGRATYTVPAPLADGDYIVQTDNEGVFRAIPLTIAAGPSSVMRWASLRSTGAGEVSIADGIDATLVDPVSGGPSRLLAELTRPVATASIDTATVLISGVDETGSPVPLSSTIATVEPGPMSGQSPGTLLVRIDPPLPTPGVYCIELDGITTPAGVPLEQTRVLLVAAPGDASGDRRVNAIDLAFTRDVAARLDGAPVNADDQDAVRADINRDGFVDQLDIDAVRAARGLDLRALSINCITNPTDAPNPSRRPGSGGVAGGTIDNAPIDTGSPHTGVRAGLVPSATRPGYSPVPTTPARDPIAGEGTGPDSEPVLVAVPLAANDDAPAGALAVTHVAGSRWAVVETDPDDTSPDTAPNARPARRVDGAVIFTAPSIIIVTANDATIDGATRLTKRLARLTIPGATEAQLNTAARRLMARTTIEHAAPEYVVIALTTPTSNGADATTLTTASTADLLTLITADTPPASITMPFAPPATRGTLAWIAARPVYLEMPAAFAISPVDINADGLIDAADLTALVDAIAANDITTGDVNGDGAADTTDMLLVRRAIEAGLRRTTTE